MRIERVKVGAHQIPVRWDDGVALVDEGRWAEFSRREPQISVAVADRSTVAQVEAFVHEVLHALMWDAGTDLDTDTEEQVVSALSPRLTAFLADNPDAVRAMLAVLE